MSELKSLQPLHPGQEMPRPYLIALLRTAQAQWQGPSRNAALRFSRHLSLAWLSYYPGDLPVNLLYGHALLTSGSTRQAIPILQEICLADPEYIEAQQLLRTAQQAAGEKPDQDNIWVADVLNSDTESGVVLPDWELPLKQARAAVAQGDIEQAEGWIHQAMLAQSMTPLIAVTHLRISAHHQLPPLAMQKLASHYHGIWPNCLAPMLYLADALMDGGSSDEAVALLHQSATRDITGQVAERVWGAIHPYQNIWPAQLKAPIEVLIPADIASALGWNRLPSPAQPVDPQAAGEGSLTAQPAYAEPPVVPAITRLQPGVHKEKTGRSATIDEKHATSARQSFQGGPVIEAGPSRDLFELVDSTSHEVEGQQRNPAGPIQPNYQPESLYSIQAELEQVAARLKKRHLARVDGRFPVYVVFTTIKGLEKCFNSKTTVLITEMKRLVAAVAARIDWDAALVIADDATCMSAYGLQPALPADPWKLKLILADLDTALSIRGEMIGALLIVGGPEVVPFHHLPNPVDDNDNDVPSDNPYATRDENYFVPEWPVGRLPIGHDADLLLNILADITTRHLRANQRRTWHELMWNRMSSWLLRKQRSASSWGYTAAIWRHASISVFRPIGESHAISVSPPIQVDAPNGKNRNRWVPPAARLGYFNLHGVKDAAEWYGQRDPAEASDDPDYPIALRPQDVKNCGHSPQIVFTEACYGAHILDKDTEQAMALKFLASGSLAVIGSTTTSYGSITTPLIAADLLGNAFWKYIKGRLPAGEALRRAKIHLAREMHRRQDYLDGEDQKTLISFVYYGDPLAQPSEMNRRAKTILRPMKTPASLKTTCDKVVVDSDAPSPKTPNAASSNRIPPEVISQVKAVVEKYLPGMVGAQMSLSYERFECSGEGHSCPSSQLGSKGGINISSEHRVITLSKQVKVEEDPSILPHPPGNVQVHWHHARLTLDNQDKVIKMAVSR